ncbi:helix-turn-helix transcriptional regulator [Flavobacterium sp. SUN046]|uniref:helix-turn-helix domain-containing protein n=1 Tax=Flavobacterium sp. SUN046 TaxID=3002440 RepID=UPI002DBB1492|nr:helix-turn-helix transcriptional regulator [Flavobacterium sp. SUN046]MEC4050174.1 helix-turn-helix transcriptional regulator [Flavobacterium sp. SUN046]
MNLGEKIRKYRRTKDIKAHTIYEKLGISQSTYSKIENNKCKIDLNILNSIAEILEIELIELIKEIPEKKPIEKNKASIEKKGQQKELIISLTNQIEILKEQICFLKEMLKNK